jgi:hypothetical protein
MSRRALLLGVVLLGLGLGRGAHADAFNDLWQKGQDDFNLGKYDQAKADFEGARDLDARKPGPWRYLGKIAQIQERWEDCSKALTEAVRLNPSSPQRGVVVKDLDACRDKLNRPKLTTPLGAGQGALTVITKPEGGQVEVDGIKKGAAPLDPPVPLNPGKHKIHVEHEGSFPVDVVVEVVPTIVVDVVVNLEPDPSYQKPKGPTEVDPNAESVQTGWIILTVSGPGKNARSILIDGAEPTYADDGTIEGTAGEHRLEVRAEGFESYRGKVRIARAQKRAVMIELRSLAGISSARTKGYLLMGGAAALAITGFVFTQLGASKAEKADDLVQAELARGAGMRVPDDGSQRHRAEMDDLESDAKKYNNLSILSFGVAAVAVGFGVYYLIQARPAEVTTEAGATAPALMPGVLAGAHGGFGATLTWSQELDW